jgi:hypothetical protein
VPHHVPCPMYYVLLSTVGIPKSEYVGHGAPPRRRPAHRCGAAAAMPAPTAMRRRPPAARARRAARQQRAPRPGKGKGR